LQPQNGIKTKQEQNYYRILQKKDGEIGKNCQQEGVKAVGMSSNQYLPIENQLDIAQENAALKAFMPNKKQKKKTALGAIKSLWPINTGMLNVAIKHVQTESAPMTSVYNLTLEKENVYYANGILVANCADALMLTFSGGQTVAIDDNFATPIPERYNSMFT